MTRWYYISFAKRFGTEPATNEEDLPEPYNEFLRWNSTLWRSASKQLTQAAKDAMK
ncbi:MAG: hypothetical protein AAGG51_00530 [Cyanobacteria bacterium P01_G01_bin.54]